MGILGNPVLLGSPPLKQTVSMASVNAEFKADIALTQVGSGTPSLTNIRPITGWSGLNLRYSGRNLVPYLGGQSSTTINGVTFTPNADGTISTSGTASGAEIFTISDASTTSLKLPVGTYKLSGCPAGGSLMTGYSLRISGGGSATSQADTGEGADFEVTDPSAGIGLTIRFQNGTSADGLTFAPMLVPEGADETFIAPKTLTVYQYDWSSQAGAIAAGTLDVLTGVLTVTRLLVDLGSLTYSFRSTYGYYRGTLPSGHTYRSYTTGGNNPADCYPSAYPYSGLLVDIPNKTITTNRGNVGANYIAIKDSDFTTEAAIKTALQGHYASVSVREETYQLTPGHIAVTPGDNYIWTDTGPVTLNLSK